MTEKSIDALTERVQRALSAPGCERLAEWAAIGPVQRAAVEQFAQSLVQPDVDALAERCDAAEQCVLMLTADHNTGPHYVRGFDMANRHFAKYPNQAAELVNAMKVKP